MSMSKSLFAFVLIIVFICGSLFGDKTIVNNYPVEVRIVEVATLDPSISEPLVSDELKEKLKDKEVVVEEEEKEQIAILYDAHVEQMYAWEEKAYTINSRDYVAKYGVHPYYHTGFRRSYPKARGGKTDPLRVVHYGVAESKAIPEEILYHEGNDRVDIEDAYQLLGAVLQRMPNMKTSYNLLDLGYETITMESDWGRVPVSMGIEKWNNFGIAQFRIDTAEETLGWLKYVRPDVHEAVMSFYNEDEDLQWNLTYNTGFSVALMYQYYWRICPAMNDFIGSQIDRAVLYKSVYNSSKGIGTLDKYMRHSAIYRDAEGYLLVEGLDNYKGDAKIIEVVADNS